MIFFKLSDFFNVICILFILTKAAFISYSFKKFKAFKNIVKAMQFWNIITF